MNGLVPYSAGSNSVVSMNGNGHVDNIVMHNGYEEPTFEELQRELPQVEEGQIPLREVLQRIVQAIYAELTEMAETYENKHFHFQHWNLTETISGYRGCLMLPENVRLLTGWSKRRSRWSNCTRSCGGPEMQKMYKKQ